MKQRGRLGRGVVQIFSVNVGEERPIQNGKSSGRSGIFKLPAEGPVLVHYGGLAEDRISDTENHGGLDQAVYLYGAPDYEWWSGELSRDIAPGTFGENLTVGGLQSASASIGDRFRVGSAVLEVTAPRIPCATLSSRMGDPSFVKRFREAERPGLYCRVIREGEVREGEEVSYEPYSGATVGAVEMFRDIFDPEPTEESIRLYLDAPIAERARAHKERQLQKLLSKRTDEPHS